MIQYYLIFQVEIGVSENGQPQLACRSHGYSASWQRKLNVSWLAFCVFVAPLWSMTASGIKIVQALGKDVPSARRLSSLQFIRRCSVAQSRMSKVKLRTMQLTVCVLLVHLTCWVPYFSVQLLNVWTEYRMKDSIPHIFGVLSQCAAWLSSCVNPIIYALFNLTVAHLRSVFCTCGRLSEDPGRPQIMAERFHARVHNSNTRDNSLREVIVLYSRNRQANDLTNNN